MRILIDVDSTIVHTLQYWLDKINERHGLNVQHHEMDQYNFFKCEPLKHIDPAAIHEMLQEPGFVYNIPIMDGAFKYIHKLNRDHKVYFVTAREGPVSMPDTQEWFEDHFPFMTKNQLIFCQDKHIIQGDILIDDSPHVLLNYRETWGDSPYLLGVKYTYNKHVDRVDFVDYGPDTWKQLYEKINAYGKLVGGSS